MRMTEAEVKKLVRQARQTKDQRKRNDAYAKLLDHLTPHFRAIVKRNYSIDPDDAWSECQMALMTAVRDYNMKHPFGFFACMIAASRLKTLYQHLTNSKRDPQRVISMNIKTTRGGDEDCEMADIIPDRHDHQRQLEDGEVVAAAYNELVPMLTAIEWDAYKAVYLEGQGYEHEGMHYKTADNALSRCKQKIKRNYRINRLKAAVG